MPLPIVGPLCDDHRARMLNGEDYELQRTAKTPIGMAPPTVLMGESLLALNEYVLLEPPTTLGTGGVKGDPVTLRVQRRGAESDTEITLLIKQEDFYAVARFFNDIAEQFGEG